MIAPAPVAAPRSPVASFIARYRIVITVVVAAMFIFLGIEAVRGLVGEIHPRQLRAALAAIPPASFVSALGLTALSYLALTLYDWGALRVVGRRLPWRTAAMASFTSYTLSHNLGFALLTGGSARLSVYREAGLDLADVARITAITSIAFWSGIFFAAALAMLLVPGAVSVAGLSLSPTAVHIAGFVVLLAVAALPIARLFGKGRIGWRDYSIDMPGGPMMAGLLVVALVDLACASAALFVLVPEVAASAYPLFFLAYALAVVAALVTHVPGGIGVFEATILAIAPVAPAKGLAALVAYRVVYYLIPLAISLLIQLRRHWHRIRYPIARGRSMLRAVDHAISPTLVALLTFGGGMVLLLSSALPTESSRLRWLADFLPLPFVEGSHFFASLVGTLLLVLAPNLQARRHGASVVARVLLVAGALFALAKGLDYEEATILATIAALIELSRGAFYRSGGTGLAQIGRRWWIAIALAVIASVAIAVVSHANPALADQSWLAAALNGDMPRAVRIFFSTVVALSFFAIWRWLSSPQSPRHPATIDPAIIDRALGAAQSTDAFLAFTGDKAFIASEAGDAFIMYRVEGHSWIVMGDPVGPQAAWPELVWRIRELSDAAHGRLCFYECSGAMLPTLIDLGLHTMKFGEAAIVDLTGGFTLDGPQFKSLRAALRHAEASGLDYAVVRAGDLDPILPELAAVSQAWLADRHGEEKCFSLGRFDEAYLRRFDIAVVRHEGRIVAFANLWALPNKAELSVDLMRRLRDAPNGAMDLLMVRTIQRGAAQGYATFSLGMAPLSGLTARRLSPLWARLGATLYGHGERFYGFSGLRAYKQKFDPEWRPRYIGTHHGYKGWRTLLDISRLVGN